MIFKVNLFFWDLVVIDFEVLDASSLKVDLNILFFFHLLCLKGEVDDSSVGDSFCEAEEDAVLNIEEVTQHQKLAVGELLWS